MNWSGVRRKQLPGACACNETPVEVTTFTDWYHQWLCPTCGRAWRGALILNSERELRRGELG